MEDDVAVVSFSTNDRPHDRITGQSFVVTNVLIAGETNGDRLANEAGQIVTDVPATPPVAENDCSEIGEAESVIQFAIGEQANFGRDARTMELELDTAVETEPPRRLSAFTRRDRPSRPALSPLSF